MALSWHYVELFTAHEVPIKFKLTVAVVSHHKLNLLFYVYDAIAHFELILSVVWQALKAYLLIKALPIH